MRPFLTLAVKAMRVGGRWRAAGERQQTPCQCWRRLNIADVTAASFGAGGCTQSYPSAFALLSSIGKSCDSAGLNTGPADLPVLRPTKFELVINTWTAKVLGLTMPQSLRMQAELVGWIVAHCSRVSLCSARSPINQIRLLYRRSTGCCGSIVAISTNGGKRQLTV